MPRYMALLKQSEGGCDYTIGCGRRWIELKSLSLSDAREELRKLIIGKRDDDYKSGYAEGYDGDFRLDTVALLEVTHFENEPVYDWYAEAAAVVANERAEAAKKAKKELYEQLKKEFE